jgi:hypothetical protein
MGTIEGQEIPNRPWHRVGCPSSALTSILAALQMPIDVDDYVSTAATCVPLLVIAIATKKSPKNQRFLIG